MLVAVGVEAALVERLVPKTAHLGLNVIMMPPAKGEIQRPAVGDLLLEFERLGREVFHERKTTNLAPVTIDLNAKPLIMREMREMMQNAENAGFADFVPDGDILNSTDDS